MTTQDVAIAKLQTRVDHVEESNRHAHAKANAAGERATRTELAHERTVVVLEGVREDTSSLDRKFGHVIVALYTAAISFAGGVGVLVYTLG